jgi:sugar (pentulose or hexulose) kinase
MRVLAIDVGSSSVKAAVWDGRRFTGRARVAYATQFDGDRAELHPETVLAAVVRAGREVRAERAQAVSFCALSSGVVVTDARGKARLPVITHQDRRSVREARGLVEALGKKWLLTHTGNLPYPGGIGSSTLAWIAVHRRAVLRGNARVGQLSSLIGHLLTGQWVIDPSQAVFLGLWDIRAWKWSKPACAAVGVREESLPRCMWADARIGGLAESVAREWGVPSGIPVVGGFVDTSAAVLQTPMRPGQLAHNSGSTDVLAMCVKTPRPMEGVLTRPVGIQDGPWLAVRTIAAAGSAIAWARQELFAGMSDGKWNATVRAACTTHDPQLGLVCTPSFSGDRTAIEQVAGATFRGIRLATTKEELLGAIVHGLLRESAVNHGMLAKIRRPAREVFFMGSASDLASAMHRAWKHTHAFHRLTSDSMAGLVTLARRAV